MPSPRRLIAISVGNTRTAVGFFEDGRLDHSERFVNSDFGPAVEHIIRLWKDAAGEGSSARSGDNDAAILIASVNDPVANRITSALEDQLHEEIYRVGPDVPVPIGEQLDPETITGVDRLLNAAAAYEILKQACVVVDAGTAITIDFVDGEGTFQGGAIAPGAAMQLKALHEGAPALPELSVLAPDDEPFGRNTVQAMRQGVFHGIRGMVQRLVERYAEAYGAFPMVIATGGDAAMLFEGEPLFDRIVPDLTLLGMEVAAKYALSEGSEDRDSAKEPG
jgi:type III pantothenate kinase